MRTNRFICAVLLFVAMIFTQRVSAQLKSSYFMEGSYFRTELNPALRPTRGYIALPLISGYSGGDYSNYNSIDNFRYELNGEYISVYDKLVPANEFLGRLPNRCVQNINSNFNLFGLGFYTLGGTYFNLGANIRLDMVNVIPKEYFRAMKNLSGEYDLENMSVGLNAYIENYVGVSYQLGDNLAVGARVKFLIGVLNANLNVNKLSVVDTENGQKYTLSGDLRTNSIEYDSSKYDGDTNPEIVAGDDASFVWNNLHSFGGAIDLGAEWTLWDDHLKLSAAITDLGFIRWSSDTQVSGKFEMELDPTDIVDLLDPGTMDMPKSFSDYTTRLTTNVTMGAEYNFLSNHFSVGLLSHTRFYRRAVATEFTASFNVRPTNWMTFTASHTFLNGNTPGIFGAAVNIHPRAINIFFGMDYIGSRKNMTDFEPTTMSEIDSMLSPKATSYNFYIGVGFNFGRPDFLIE